ERGQRREVALGIVRALAGSPLEVRVVGEELAGIELESGAERGCGGVEVAVGLGASGALVVLLEKLAVGGDAAHGDLIAIVLEVYDARAAGCVDDATELADRHVEAMRGSVGVHLGPQEVHQGVARDGLAGVRDEVGAELAERAAAADGQLLATAIQGEAAEEGGEERRLAG